MQRLLGLIIDKADNQWVSETTFFSRISKSLRSILETRVSLMRRTSIFKLAMSVFKVATSVFKLAMSILDKSDFLASWFTIPVRVSTFSLRPFKPSPKILNWPRRSSISAPTSVTVNLSTFFGRFFMDNSIMKKQFSVKKIIPGDGIYNYARTAEQIMQDYNQGLAAKLGD